jgi:serine protease AprX
MKYWLILGFWYCIQAVTAQHQYWVYFNDKPNEEASVSEKAKARYAKSGYAPTLKDAALNEDYIRQVITITNGNLRTKSRWFNAISIEVADVSLIANIQLLPFVKQTAVLKKLYKPKTEIETPYKDRISSHDALQPGVTMLSAQFLADRGYNGEGMTIAVIDNGFRNANQMAAFSHVFSENRVLGYYDFVDNDTTVFDAGAGTHGQQVWGFMAARLPGEYVGTAPNANYWLFRTEASAFEQEVEEDYWLAAAEMADSVGVDLITSSLNYTTFNDTLDNHSYADLDGNTTIITKAADEAAKRGIFVVCSAGNYGSGSWKYVGAPADGDSVLAVGAVNTDGVIAGFSSFGPTYDGRTKPDVLAWGQQAAYVSSAGTVLSGNGTSFAAPITAGLVACLWQAFPNKTANEIRLAIIETAQQYASPTDQRGNGLSDFCLAYKKLGGVFCFEDELAGDDLIAFAYYNDATKQIELNLDLNGTGVGTITLFALSGDLIQQLSFEYINETGLYQLNIPLPNEGLLHQVIIIQAMLDGNESTIKVVISK